MIGYVAVGNNIYDGSAKVGAEALENGMFVDKIFADGEFTVVAGDTYMVCQEDDQAEPCAVSSIDFKAQPGAYVKLKNFLPGEKFVTDVTDVEFNLGDACSVQGGKLVAGAEGAHAGHVIEILHIDGITCYMCEVE